MISTDRNGLLRDLLAARIVIIDGAAGTSIQNMHLTAADFGGPQLEGCNENLILTRPDKIRELHEGYLDAGADMIETNTFGATSVVLAEYGLAEHAREMNRLAGPIARDRRGRRPPSKRPRFVAGSMGPTTKAISVTGGVTFDQLADAYQEQAEGSSKAAWTCCCSRPCRTRSTSRPGWSASSARSRGLARVPIAVSGTIEPMGTMLAGQDVEALLCLARHIASCSAVGLNCATGPEFMTDHLRTLSAISPLRTSPAYPNAGLPDEDGHYNETPEIARAQARALRATRAGST